MTDEFARSGNYSWTDSPGEFYQNNIEKSISMKIDLRTATMPVLSFWHRYSLETNKDYGYVDVSLDAGATWTTRYFVTGHTTDWREEKIDLTEYALLEDVRIRFRLKTDGQNRYDGWYIDDVRISETTGAISYPFSDDMEDVNLTEENWISSSWELLTTDAHSGARCWTDSPEGDMPAAKTYSSLTLNGTIDLSTAVNPQLTFWHHHELYHGYVEVSDNYGQSGTHTKLKTYSHTQGDWVQEQVDLSDYAGSSNVRIRFRPYNRYGYSGYDGWYVDDVRIGEPSDAIPPASITNLHNTTYAKTHINWEWTDPADADFSKVMVYLDGDFETNVSKATKHYNATGLTPDTEHEIGMRTVDSSGNINLTWVNQTARTKHDTAALAEIAISPTSCTLNVGGSQTFTATCYDTYSNVMTCPTLTWTSTNTTVGTITSGGVFTALAAGTTAITAGADGVTSNAAAVTVGEGVPVLVSYTITNRTITPPQTTSIDVEFSESVDYIIAIENGAETIYDWTGTDKDPDPKVWDGTYEVNGTVVPDGTYRVNVTGTNATTGLGVINTTESIKVTTTSHSNNVYFVPQYSTAGFGNPATVQIRINGTNIAGAYIDFTYNPACVNVTGVQGANFPRDWDWNSATSGRETIAGTTSDGLNRTGDYLFANLTIQCLCKDCVTGLNFSDGSSDLFDQLGTSRPATWTNGTFECRGLCGDVNRDGNVNYGDVILLRNHLLHGFPISDPWAADVNCQGGINYGDVILLRNHIMHGFPLNCC